MKTKVLSLNIDKSMSYSRFKARLESSINPYTDDCQFVEFEDIRELFIALQSALNEDGIIITAVDTKYYLKFKNALIQAFGTDVVYNSSILNKIEALELDDKKKKAFSTFPEPATVFVSEDGLYSGMVMENGSQYLVLLPIDNDRIDGILRNGLVPFLNKRFVADDVIEEKPELSPVQAKVAIAVNSILESNSLVAINGTRNAEVLKSCGNSVEGFNNAFVFTPYVEDKGNINPTEYTAQLARASLDLSAANIGACISDIYSSAEAKFICIAVSKDDTALVRKLYKAENESEQELVESAALELIELIGEKAAGKRSVGIEITDDNAITEEDKKIVNKKPLAILAIIVGIAVVLCAVIGILSQNKNSSGIADMLGSIFNKEASTDSISTTSPPPTETTTEEIPVQPYNPNLMKLSDYLVAQIMSMDESEISAKMAQPSSKPDFITVNGEKIEPKEALARLLTAELGSGYRLEAVKAQTVAAYTCLKFLGNDYVIDGVRISETYNSVVMDAVEDVYGEYLTFNGALALPVYHNLSAGVPFDMSAKLPYLKSVVIDNAKEDTARDFISEKIYSVDEMKAILLKNNGTATLSENPAEWVVVKSHDASISENVGYVTSVSFNGVEMTGIDFRMNIMNPVDLPSLCFSITYDEALSRFIITSYGQGYGVGMSLNTAKLLASEGNGYKLILGKYYEGTVIAKEMGV